MEVKVRRDSQNASLPVAASRGAACFDLKSSLPYPVWVHPGHPVVIPTGLFFEFPEGFAMMVYSRSGHGFTHDVRLSNCVGIIDADYRGELMVKLTADKDPYVIKPFERIAQAMIIPVPAISFVEADTLSTTERGAGGFGSTGAN